MTKRELIDRVRDGIYRRGRGVNLRRKDVTAVLEWAFSAIGDDLRRERGKRARFVWPGFGVFRVRTRAQRFAVHPVTGERIVIAPRKTVVFEPAQEVAADLNRQLRRATP